jgi:hypothetical protein
LSEGQSGQGIDQNDAFYCIHDWQQQKGSVNRKTTSIGDKNKGNLRIIEG